MTKPDITVAIPTYNREEVLINTIHDVLNQSHENLELVVIDQSKDHRPETLSALRAIKDKRFRYFVVDPPSVTAARNFALKAAKAPIILYLDDDVELDKDLVKNHLAVYEKSPGVSAVAGRVLQAGFPIKKEVLRFDEYGITHGVFTATRAAYTNAFPGGNCSMRVADAFAVGGFDTRYHGNAFREENDMSIKMHRAGYKIYFEPKAKLFHLAAPYGGNRIHKDILDSSTFYKNELFFTARVAGLRYYFGALRRKFREYCNDPGWSKKVRIRRSLLFLIGLLASWWNLLFGRQIVARERPG